MPPSDYSHPKIVWVSMLCFVVFFLLWAICCGAPTKFPTSTADVFTVESGDSVETIANNLFAGGLLRFPFVFRTVVRLSGNERALVAGDYAFTKPLDVFGLVSRISRGDFDLTPVRITIPEGLNKFEIADLLALDIAHFDRAVFIELAPEGYLFPDTYFFARNATPETIVDTMRDNFDKKVSTIAHRITASRRSLEDIVSLASIVELEARQTETRRTVAGVLWKRLDENMPLQVDVSFKYINGKTTAQITQDDLALDSPYNSYKYRGLPPTPISNPGLDSLLAAIEPIKTPYLFFLSDSDGVMHYAKTFDEHKKNKAKYLR